MNISHKILAAAVITMSTLPQALAQTAATVPSSIPATGIDPSSMGTPQSNVMQIPSGAESSR